MNAVERVVDQMVPLRLRNHRNNHYGGMSAAVMHPLGIVRFRPGEGGTVNTRFRVKLAPVSGYMRTPAYVHIQTIFVPYQAIEALEMDTEESAGVTEMTRKRMEAGTIVGLEDEGVITQAANVHPRSIAGAKRLKKSARLSYVAAVNHNRKAAYHDATLLDKNHATIAPATLTANILERFDGVLDPETLVDGAINLTGNLPVKGIGKTNQAFTGAANSNVVETDGNSWSTYASSGIVDGATANDYWLIEEDPNKTGYPNIRANLDGADELTLRDMVKSKKTDELVRKFAQLIDADPINGEQRVARALYGLNVDYDANCQVLFDEIYELAPQHERPMDGASINDISAHFEVMDSYSVAVPRAELGGQLVTIAMVKPLETTAQQPDPAQTENVELINRIHDQTELDEVLLTRADLETGVDAADEDQPAFWVGYNSEKHNYVTRGPNVHNVDVANKSSQWVYEVPTSTTPENVNYPAVGTGAGELSMYPFYNWNGDHAVYGIDQVAMISTPLAKGPTPVERIQLFADDPTLVDPDA